MTTTGDKVVRGERLTFLDGLRGWASVAVLLSHVYGYYLVDIGFPRNVTALVPLNGTLAVYLFFIVSGISLSIRYLADGDPRALGRIAAGRYVRLFIPIFAICLLAHIGMVVGLIDAPAARLESFQSVLNFDPTIGHLLKFTTFDVFFNYSPTDSYAGPLWTMSIELYGSILVVLAIPLLRPLPLRIFWVAVLAGLFLLLAPTYHFSLLSMFLLGVIVADAINRNWAASMPRPIGWTLIAVGWIMPLVFAGGTVSWGFIAAGSLVFGSAAVSVIRKWLSNPLSAFLGRISFPLYLLHGPVLCFVGEPLLRQYGQNLVAAGAINCVVVVLSLGAAIAFVPVNEFAIRSSRWLGRFVVRGISNDRPGTLVTRGSPNCTNLPLGDSNLN